jgi:hypothetical protein
MSWARFLIPVLLVVTVAAAYLTRGPNVKRSHGRCLVHTDCPASERCLVPVSTDGFATAGACVDPCEDDLQCAAQFRCERVSDVQDYFSLDRSKGTVGAVGACVAGGRKGAE